MSLKHEHVKLAVALRTARSIAGWSQAELSRNSGIPKITIARVETLEGSLKAEYLIKLLNIYLRLGVKIDLSASEGFTVTVDDKLLKLVSDQLQDEANWRSDRKKSRKALGSLLG
jgi:transcriptional regulator with XRE-family HTH domain